MTDDRDNALARREIIGAYIEVLDRLDVLLETCSAVEGDAQELRSSVQEAFGLSPRAADAILSMQVRRFTPNERQRLRAELAEIDLRLEGASDA